MSSGGYRPNAGRKRRCETTRFMVSIQPSYADRIKAKAKEDGITIGELVERMVDTALG